MVLPLEMRGPYSNHFVRPSTFSCNAFAKAFNREISYTDGRPVKEDSYFYQRSGACISHQQCVGCRAFQSYNV